MSQVKEEHIFDVFANQMRASLANALKWGDGKLYTTDVQNLDEVYLSGFADPADRQYHNCSACKSFLRRYGGLVVTNGKETRSALWDGVNPAGVPQHFVNTHSALARAVGRARINVYAQASAATKAMRSWGL